MLLCLISNGGVALINSFDFIDATLEDFNNRVVPAQERTDFTTFYNGFIRNLESLAPAKKRVELQRVRELGRSSLEVRHPEWANQLKPYAFYERDEKVCQEKELASLRTFLTRNGVYEEFLKTKAFDSAGMWNRFKSYTKHTTAKMTNWVSSWLPQRKTT